jgi:hypothetical protein
MLFSFSTLVRYARRLRLAGGIFAATLLAGVSGCSMCCAPYDCDFGYTGGAWVRDNPSWGRVGSVFEPAGYKAVGDDPAANAEEVPTPAGQPDESQPMTEPDNMTEPTSPRSLPSNMTSAPRLRRLQPYLPEN